MALYRVRLVLEMGSGIPEDRAVWSWGVDGAAPSAAALMAAMETRMFTGMNGWSGNLANRLASGTRMRQMEVYEAIGGPAIDVAGTTVGTFGDGFLPPQVGMSVSSDVLEGAIVKPRGRIIFGPLGDNNGGGRPTAGNVNGYLNWCVAWHADLVGLGLTPVVINSAGTVGTPIVGYSLGNAYSTMRTRKWEATTRTAVLVP